MKMLRRHLREEIERIVGGRRASRSGGGTWRGDGFKRVGRGRRMRMMERSLDWADMGMELGPPWSYGRDFPDRRLDRRKVERWLKSLDGEWDKEINKGHPARNPGDPLIDVFEMEVGADDPNDMWLFRAYRYSETREVYQILLKDERTLKEVARWIYDGKRHFVLAKR